MFRKIHHLPSKIRIKVYFKHCDEVKSIFNVQQTFLQFEKLFMLEGSGICFVFMFMKKNNCRAE